MADGVIVDTFALDPPPTAPPTPPATPEEQAEADRIVRMIMLRERVHGSAP